jgi:hypothetical protein
LLPVLRKMMEEADAPIHDGLLAGHLAVLVTLIGVNGSIA